MQKTLIIMAAGFATRYGGNKQTTGMGPHGELLLEYSAHDAIRAGFNQLVFIIRPEMKERVMTLCGNRLSRKISVEYANQDFTSLPPTYHVPIGRVKPFGTVHAVLCARDVVSGPFAVINADDYYGADAFRVMSDCLERLAAPSEAAMVGYRLKNTISPNGSVTRGVCAVTNDMLTDVREIQKIVMTDAGRILDVSDGEPGVPLDPDALVSMNFWGFHPGIFPRMQQAFEGFLRGLSPNEARSEYQLPTMVGQLLEAQEISVEVLRTQAVWFGVTYQEDRPRVQQALHALHDAGIYGNLRE